MKRLIFIILFLCALGAMPAYAAWYGLDSPTPSDVSVNISHASASGLLIQANVPGFEVTEPENDFVDLALNEEGHFGETGAPSIPVINRLVRVPFGASVALIVRGDFQTVPISEFTGASYLMPAQPSIPKIPGAREAAVFTINWSAYQSAEAIFDAPAAVVDEGIMRGYRFAIIQIRPVNYLPAQGLVKIAANLTVEVRFLHPDMNETSYQETRYADPRTAALASNLFLNPDSFGGKADTFAPASFLIIGPEAVFEVASMQDYVAWKTQRGYDVVTAAVEDIGAETAAIKGYIQDAYDNWERPPAYVLLVGDVGQVPVITGTTGAATDLYYAATAGSDYFPDLGIGRLSITSTQHLNNILNKILVTERNEWTTDDAWTQHATFMASTDNWNISEGTHNTVCQYFLEPAGFDCTKVYSAHGGTTQQAIAALNTGPTIHAYSGHGSQTSWADGPQMNQAQVRNLTNTTYPLVLSHACLTNSFKMAECFGETWIRTEHGALAFWGATESTYWTEDDILEKAMFYGWFRGVAPRQSMPWISGMLQFSLGKLYEELAGGGYTKLYFEMYNLLGDPEVLLYSAPPVTPTPVYDEFVPEGTTTFQVSVPDHPFAMIGLYANDQCYGAAYADANGEASVTLYRPVDVDSFDLTITGENLAPYFGQITYGAPPVDDDTNPGDDDTVDDDDATPDDDDSAADDDATPGDDDDDDNDDNNDSGGGCS